MLSHVRANLWLLALTLLLGAVIYPLSLLAIGQSCFRDQAEGSLIDKDGRPTTTESQAVGSRLIAQPFTGDAYFWPRPSAASYNGAASGASNWAANNYLLRDRVAQQIGPIVKYRGGPQAGQLAAPDVEAWFAKDRFAGQRGIVAQWANAHGAVAQNWVTADPLHSAFVAAWQQKHPQEVSQWIKDHPHTPQPKPEDLAVPLFVDFSQANPGMFPAAVDHKLPGGKTEKRIEPVNRGSDIQAIFFDMWLQDHPDADLELVPSDMVMASGSGLDPHITFSSALYQLDRVAADWAKTTKRPPAEVRKEIDALLYQQAAAPLGGLAGTKLVNVLETNLALRAHFGSSAKAASSGR